MDINLAIRAKAVLGKLQAYQKKYKQLLDSDVMLICDWGMAGNRENIANIDPKLFDDIRRVMGEYVAGEITKLETQLKEL